MPLRRRPCIALFYLVSHSNDCVEVLKGHTEAGVEEGYHAFSDVHFATGQKDRVLATFTHPDLSVAGTATYARAKNGTWSKAAESKGKSEEWHGGLQVSVKEDLNQPPMLVGADKETPRVIWDPNPQLKSFDFGEVTSYRWKDKSGREVEGNLYKPANYRTGQRYPLVIQTHGSYAGRFRPSGEFTTAFAAQELAAAGIVVLQVYERCFSGESPREGPCAVSVYESAVNKLAAEGLVNPENVGLIGFSRTCFYVMEALGMESALHLRAASVNDGYMNDYLQFMMDPSPGKTEPWNGGAPFGDGLQLWLKRSPSFNLDKVHVPLLIMTGSGGQSMGGLFMWGPYAGLYSLRKPVDLILLNTNEHGITNPAVRMVSQGTNLDWFRFWLQKYEDPDPAKAEQYKRWRGLQELQDENEKKSTAAQSSSR
jgi:dipeptidyl aminopeptidase/acylaminoacyl peptidase